MDVDDMLDDEEDRVAINLTIQNFPRNQRNLVAEKDAEIDRLRTLARDARQAWDNDRDTTVGKLLIAMLDEKFCQAYRPDLMPNA